MMFKPEVIQALQREQRVCQTAVARLREQTQPLESEYGWSTEQFLQKFESGEAGDEQVFFRWYALAEAIREWQEGYDSLKELLAKTELVGA